MKNKNRIWIMVTILALVSVTFSACGGGGDGGGEQEPSAPTSAPPTSAPAPTPTLSAGDHVEMGMEYSEQGEVEQAIAEFEKAIELDPNDANAHRNLGSAYVSQGKWQDAAAAYEKAIELAPDFGEAYGDLTGAYFNLGKIEEAIAAGEKAIELAPDYAMAYNNLGIVYGSQGQLDEAITLLQNGIQADPDCADAHYNLGFAYENLGQLDTAIAEYREAVRADPDYVDAYENMGTVYARQGLYDEAIAEFETFLQVAPPDDPGRAQVESWLAELQGAPTEAGGEYHNAEGGYSLPYPQGWYYTEDEVQVIFGESAESLDVAPAEAIMIMFTAAPLDEIVESAGPDASTDPAAALQAMAGSIGAETGEIETGQIAGQPAALADVSGSYQDAPYSGGIVAVLVGDKVVYGVALSPPDQWEDFNPTFLEMLNGLSFSQSEYGNAEGGYNLVVPDGWVYEEDNAMVALAPTQQALEIAEEIALGESPLIAFDASPLAELAENLGVSDHTDPVEFAEAMSASFDAEVGNIETGQVAGYPAAYANISGALGDTPYTGGLIAILVEDRVIGAYAMSPPDSWGDVRPIFSDMLDGMSFFEP